MDQTENQFANSSGNPCALKALFDLAMKASMRVCMLSYSLAVVSLFSHVRNAFIEPMTAGCPAKVPMTYATRAACGKTE